MSEESKKFGAQYDANVYSSYRKDTPIELIEKIIAFLKEKVPEPLETAVDVGCGNGQSTVILAPYFKRVHGSDVSEAQIEQAKASRSLPNVTYAASPAEKLPFGDGAVQLLTAATALHWFDLDTFLPEARRVLCVNGVLAAYGYLNMQPLLDDPARAAEVDELYVEYYKALEPYHVMSRVSLLQNRYKDVKFPFEEVNRCPDVRCCFEGKLPDIVNYVSTWSGYQNFKKADIKGAEELLDYFKNRFRNLLTSYMNQHPSLNVDIEQEVKKYKEYASAMAPFVTDTVTYLHEAIASGKRILVEGANAALLDIDFGTYPYVTSSNCTVGGACTGLGIPPTVIGEIYGVVKAYSTRVGDGPFPTELMDGLGEILQTRGHEIGVTTKRKRRCGWLDVVLLRYSNMINGYTAVAVTKLDILDTFAELKIGVAYRLNNKRLLTPPSCASELQKVEVEYITLPGWNSCTEKVREFSDLPENAKNYISTIEELAGVKVKWIGVGKDRSSMIEVF